MKLDHQKRNSCDVPCRRPDQCHILPNTEFFSHGKYCPKHNLCHHEFSCRLSDISPQSVFQSGLCRQRCRPHRLMDISESLRQTVHRSHRMLCDVFGK